jgi:hypothetical protein
MPLPPPDRPATPTPKPRWPRWRLVTLLLVLVIGATALPLQGRVDLVIRPLLVIALLLVVGARIDRRQ